MHVVVELSDEPLTAPRAESQPGFTNALGGDSSACARRYVDALVQEIRCGLWCVELDAGRGLVGSYNAVLHGVSWPVETSGERVGGGGDQEELSSDRGRQLVGEQRATRFGYGHQADLQPRERNCSVLRRASAACFRSGVIE